MVGADAAAERRPARWTSKGAWCWYWELKDPGLRHLTQQNCDFLVRLPQLGAVENLDVSVAAGMLLYEAVRQRRAP